MKIVIFVYILITIIYPVSAYAAAATPSPNPCFLDPNSADYQNYVKQYGPCAAGLNQFENIMGNLISVLAGIGFIATLVLLVWAGFKYLTSGGEPKAVQAAHAVTTWALLGILFMVIAWLALQLVAAFTGINVTVFSIKALCGGAPTLPFCTP